MTRREKIILAATGLVAVVALGFLYTDGGPPAALAPASQPQSQAAAQVREAATALTRQAAAGRAGAAGLAAIDKPWRIGAFYDTPLEGRGGGKPAVVPRFTGYVELGSGRLAVIDGYEYQAGDTLEGGGYKVLAVSTEKVVLESLANGQRLEIPYDGQDALGR